jgi:hypothetical protein
MAMERAHHALQSAKTKSRNHLNAIKLAAKEFDADIKYMDLVIRVSVCFVEACWVQMKGFEVYWGVGSCKGACYWHDEPVFSC